MRFASISIGETEDSVSALTVRNLDEAVSAKLKARAVQHGRSMESEARAILAAAVAAPISAGGGLGSRIAALFADVDGFEVERSREPARAVVFEQ
jgi:plasmid stability protein